MVELRDQCGRKANIVHVEAKEHQLLAARYGVRSIPTQLIYDPTGQEIFRHPGFIVTDDLKAELSQAGVD